MKIVTFLGLAAMGIVCLAQGAQAQSDSEFVSAIGSMQHSVAPVMCIRAVQPQLQPMGQQQIPSLSPASPQLQPAVAGTAFFLTRRGDFVTAASVLANFYAPGVFADCTMMVWFTGPVGPTGNFSSQSFAVALSDCVVDGSIDVARCRTIGDLTKEYDGGFAPEPVVLDTHQPGAGSSIATSGFILFDTIPIAARCHIGGYQPAPPAAMQMIIDRTPAAGAAGSPVYDSRGKVLGMVAQVRDVVLTNISVASTSLAITRFLAAHPIGNK